MLVFRQLFDPQSSTYTYLLGDTRRGAPKGIASRAGANSVKAYGGDAGASTPELFAAGA